MAQEEQKNIVGSHEWFQTEALNALKKIADGFWDYSNSSVVYTPENSLSYKQLQNDAGHTSYKESVTSAEHSLIKLIAPQIVEKLPHKFQYIDFGPGTEHKEKYFLEAIDNQNKEALYVPLDISEQMLDIADTYAKQRGFKTHPIHQTFEHATAEIKELDSDFRFVSLGMTFANYKAQQILAILDKTTNKNGTSFITVQMRDRVDIEKIKKIYTESVSRHMLHNKIKLIGLNPETDIVGIEANDKVEVVGTVKNTNPMLDQLGIKPGDRMLLLRSYRFSYEELEDTLKDYDTHYYDEGKEFIGCVINHC